jgi:hypothetical protein
MSALCRYRPEPLLPRHLSRTQSAVASAVKRHGHLLAKTFVAGVNATRTRDLLATEIASLVTRAGNRQVDTLIFHRHSGRFSILGIKRGGGQQPAGCRRDQEDRLTTISSAIGPVARTWLRSLGVMPPKRLKFDCAVLAYYGEYGSTTLQVICRPEIATRYGPEALSR